MPISETLTQAADREARWNRWLSKGQARDRDIRHSVRTTLLAVGSFLLLLVAVVLTIR